jgi:hypothetical protein
MEDTIFSRRGGKLGFFDRGLKHKTKDVYTYKRNGKEVYRIEWENDFVSLYHYGTKLITLDALNRGKIVYGTDIYLSLSDKTSIYEFTWGFDQVYGKKVEEYVIYHSKLYYGEELKKKKEQLYKFRKGILDYLNSLPDAIPLLEKLGFEVNLIHFEYEEREAFAKKYNISTNDSYLNSWFVQPNKLFFETSDMENMKLKATHVIRKLNNVQMVKTVLFRPYEPQKEVNERTFELYDVRVSGIDESGQLWSLRAPLGYYLASIQACERWFLGIRKEDEVVLEQ